MNYILIRNTIASHVEATVSQLSELYTNTGFVNSVIIHKAGIREYLIEFPGNPDFYSFLYYVNYLQYPENIKHYEAKVFGIWKVSEPLESIHSPIGESLLIYVSGSDTEYDNVSIETGNSDVYKYSFSGQTVMTNLPEHDYKELTLLPEHYEEYMEIIPSREASHRLVKPWWKFW